MSTREYGMTVAQLIAQLQKCEHPEIAQVTLGVFDEVRDYHSFAFEIDQLGEFFAWELRLVQTDEIGNVE